MTTDDASPTNDPTGVRGDEVYERLFGSPPDPSAGPDPELMVILRRVIFGDVFSVGDLDDTTRELITLTVLATLQCLPQLTSHTAAALHVGCTPIEIRESLYQLASFIGFPRTLNAVGAMNSAFEKAGIDLPLEPQGTVSPQDRYTAGHEIQMRLYGDEIKDALDDGTEFGAALPRILTEFCFGDFESRDGLDVATRELLILCALVTLNLTPQIAAHIRGCRTAGVSLETVAAAIVHVGPYAGLGPSINAYRALLEYKAANP